MAASDDLQFDMAAALVAVMVVLFDLVYKEANEPTNPSPGAVEIDLVFVEQPFRKDEVSLFNTPPQLTFEGSGVGNAAVPFFDYAPSGGGGTIPTKVSCGLAGEPTVVLHTIYEGSNSDQKFDSQNNAVDLDLRQTRYGIKMPPHQGEYVGSDLALDTFIETFGLTGKIAVTDALWPTISSDRFNGGRLDIIYRDSAQKKNRAGRLANFRIDTEAQFRRVWKNATTDVVRAPDGSIRLEVSEKVFDRLAEVNGSPPSADRWLAHRDDIWLLAALLPFRPLVHIKCQGFGKPVRSGSVFELSFARNGCPAGSVCSQQIRHMELASLRVSSSLSPVPLEWYWGTDMPDKVKMPPGTDRAKPVLGMEGKIMIGLN